MSLKTILLFLAISFVALGPVLASSASSTCRELFGSQETTGRNIKTSLQSEPLLTLPLPDSDFRKFPLTTAVYHEAMIPVGKNGEGYYLLKKANHTWRSANGPNKFAVDSDPTWFVSVLGPKLAKAFGVGFTDSTSLMVSNAERMNNRIERMNAKLHQHGFEDIPLRFSSDITKGVSFDLTNMSYPEIFVRRLLRDRVFPLAPSEITHDTSHHRLNVLLTLSQLAPEFARLGALTDFADYVRSPGMAKNSNIRWLSNENYREAFLKLMFQMVSKETDNLSGTIPPELVRAQHSNDVLANNTYLTSILLRLGTFTMPIGSGLAEVGRKYTVFEWLFNLVTLDVAKVFDNTSRDPFGRYFMNLKNGYDVRANIRQHHDDFFREVNVLLSEFQIRNQTKLEQTLVVFDSQYEVVAGLADKEHPVKAMQRRISEMKKSIGAF